MKQILETLIKNLVNNPEDVEITEKQEEKEIIYEVKVNNDDFGRVIGRQGKIAKSIRTIMKSIAVKKHKKIVIEFLN